MGQGGRGAGEQGSRGAGGQGGRGAGEQGRKICNRNITGKKSSLRCSQQFL
ncbi:hypothetical protein JYQ62_12070 [Nostoc sp. UHCC 0702]|nr:hypothetical protein JYQ62_12070 [Nostoc sp. UHCC 0702]